MNTALLEKLAKLADELDSLGSVKFANELDKLIKEVMEREKRESADIEENLTICPICDGEGGSDEEPFCAACSGSGFVALAAENAGFVKNAFIRKRKNQWCVVSKKNKSLGCYKTRKEALKRLRQIEFFKHNK